MFFTGVCLFNFRGRGYPHLADQGVPIPGQDEGGEGTPSQVRTGGTPIQLGVPSSQAMKAGYSIQLRGRGTPIPGQDGGYHISGQGVPPSIRLYGGIPLETELHSQYLLHGGRYASCVHAGGLSCFFCVYLLDTLNNQIQ